MNQSNVIFKWTCLATACIFGLVTLWVLLDLKRDVTQALHSAQATVAKANESVATVNDQLPEIVSQVKQGTETLSALSEDVKLIKSVAGLENEKPDRGLRSLANYAEQIQSVLEKEGQGGKILIEEIFGSDLKEVESVEEFLVGLNKEMIAVILPLAKSKQEVLFRTSHSGPPRRKPYYIRLGESDPIRVDDFLRTHHSESASLPVFDTE